MCSLLVMSESAPTTPKSSTMQQANFLLLCGLVLQDSRDRKVFEKMEVCLMDMEIASEKLIIKQEEVGHAAERLLSTLQIRQRGGAPDSSPAGMATASLITETAMQAEISRTFEMASPETKAIYGLSGGDDGGNWMIRWMLWGRITRAVQ